MVQKNIPQTTGKYTNKIMRLELSRFLGRQSYENADEDLIMRNGCCRRRFSLKSMGEAPVQVLPMTGKEMIKLRSLLPAKSMRISWDRTFDIKHRSVKTADGKAKEDFLKGLPSISPNRQTFWGDKLSHVIDFYSTFVL